MAKYSFVCFFFGGGGVVSKRLKSGKGFPRSAVQRPDDPRCLGLLSTATLLPPTAEFVGLKCSWGEGGL